MPLAWFILITAYGACVGSFLNVVIYRLPLGQSIVHPPSRCPKCSHKLAWHDNVPVLGWLWLRGKCRYCKAAISPQYPIIEALTAVLFAALLYAYYVAGYRSDFAAVGLAGSWPVLVVHLVMLGGLIAATAIDARLYIIPLSIPYVIALLAVIVFPGVEKWWPPGVTTLMPAAEGRWIGLAFGGLIGLIVANVLLRVGVFKQSFAVVEEVQPQEDAKPQAGHEKKVQGEAAGQRGRVQLILALFIVAVVAGAFGLAWGFAGAVVLLMLGVLPLAVVDDDRVTHEEVVEMIYHPLRAREVMKELAFLLPVVVGAAGGWFVPICPDLPGWLHVLAGVVLGFLAGGAIVWLVRILGTLAFGKEAMGLGDVHLLAGIGAVLGPVDAVVVFFMAPFFGLAHALMAFGLSRLARGSVRVIPFGPFLAAAAVVVAVFHELILRVLGIL